MLGTEPNSNANTNKPGQEFAAWISSNVDNIKNGSAVYKGERITLETELIRYEMCYSFLVVFVRQSSAYFIVGSPEANKTAVLATLTTALCGWWSLHGIIFTPIILMRNILRSNKLTVGQLFEKAEAPPKKAHPASRLVGVLALVAIFGFFVWIAMSSKGN